MAEGIAEENGGYKIFMLHLLFNDYLKDSCKPELLRSDTTASQSHLEYFQRIPRFNASFDETNTIRSL